MQSATSCAVPILPIGAMVTAGSSTSAFGFVIGVSITPGQTLLTRMRSLEYCICVWSVNYVTDVAGSWKEGFILRQWHHIW